MAIYHASTQPIARSTGRSAVAAAAYRAGCELVDERTGLVHDYRRKGGVLATDLLLPDGGAVERAVLWNAAERAEARKDARTAREWVIALPAELSAPERAVLAREFAGALATRYGVAVDVALHQPDREGDHRNHHAHLLTTTRQVYRNPDGTLALGDKASIELSDKARRARGLGSAAEEVTAIRQLWEQIANRALERAGHAARIDARRLEAQGLDREATTHLGPVATAMERRTVPSDRGEGNRQVIAHNRERAALAAKIVDLQAERHRRQQERQAAEARAQAEAERQRREVERQRREAERLRQAVDEVIALENTRAALQTAEAALIAELPAKLDAQAFTYFREVKDTTATEADARRQMVTVLVDSLGRRIREAGHAALPAPALLEEAAQRCYGPLVARLAVLEAEEAERRILLSADIPALERERLEWTREHERLARHEPPPATWLADKWGELSRAQRTATAAGQALDELETAYADWRKVHKLGLLLIAGLPGSKRREVPVWEQKLAEARTVLEQAQATLAVAREAYDVRLPAAECEARQMVDEQRQQIAALQRRIDERGDFIQRAKVAQEAERERREAEARAQVEGERQQRDVEQRKPQEPERPSAEPPASKQEPPKFAIPAPRPKPNYPSPGG
ncbi:MAG TPA: MobQ family relaxase [Candidatus Competibacter phosphatis]|nr:MobQ family relaxase [Candidatus Competibacter phosphatis]HMR03501.1 MobQ family relaxase [Candidatus Competibacter phosphatis]